MTERFSEDARLISMAQRGDRAAFNTLIRKHEARAYQYAFRLTRNADTASDIVADAFVRVVNALPNFKGNSAFSTWLYRIVTNCYLDARKKERSRPVTSLDSVLHSDEGDMVRQIEDPAATPDEVAMQRDKERRMADAVASLPDYQRALLTMFHGEHMTYDEIATAMDLPVGTVKSRLNRARLALRENLDANEELFRG